MLLYCRATPDYQSCNTIEVKSIGNLPKTLFAWAFTKNSPTWKIVNYFIIQLNEAGALDALITKWEPRHSALKSEKICNLGKSHFLPQHFLKKIFNVDFNLCNNHATTLFTFGGGFCIRGK